MAILKLSLSTPIFPHTSRDIFSLPNDGGVASQVFCFNWISLLVFIVHRCLYVCVCSIVPAYPTGSQREDVDRHGCMFRLQFNDMTATASLDDIGELNKLAVDDDIEVRSRLLLRRPTPYLYHTSKLF